jgi:hypothetical protein
MIAHGLGVAAFVAIAGLFLLALGLIGKFMLWVTGNREILPMRELPPAAINDPFGVQFIMLAYFIKPGWWLACSGIVGLVVFGLLTALFE